MAAAVAGTNPVKTRLPNLPVLSDKDKELVSQFHHFYFENRLYFKPIETWARDAEDILVKAENRRNVMKYVLNTFTIDPDNRFRKTFIEYFSKDDSLTTENLANLADEIEISRNILRRQELERKIIPEPVPEQSLKVGDRIKVPLMFKFGKDEYIDSISGTVKFAGDCSWFVTEAIYREFFEEPPAIDADVTSKYPKFGDALKELSAVMPLEARKAILRKMSHWDSSELPPDFHRVLKRAHGMVKRNQIIGVEVKYKANPPIVLWYEAHNCNPETIVSFAGEYGSSMETGTSAPVIEKGVFHPKDIEKYKDITSFFEKDPNAPQAITSWINHGFTSTWLRKRDEVLRNLAHPLIGDEEFAKYIDLQQTNDLNTFYAISETASDDLITYRFSYFWLDKGEKEIIKNSSILATTPSRVGAFTFGVADEAVTNRRAVKKLIVSPGVRFVDLRKFNDEGEIVILPEPGKPLILTPVHRGTYRIMNSSLGLRSIENVNEYRVTTKERRRKTRRLRRLSRRL